MTLSSPVLAVAAACPVATIGAKLLGTGQGAVGQTPAMGSRRGCRFQERPQKGLPRPDAWLRKLGEGFGHEGIGVRLQVYVTNASFLPGQACHCWLGQQ